MGTKSPIASSEAPARPSRTWAAVSPFLVEVALLGLLFVIYRAGRVLSAHEITAAARHAQSVIDFERLLHLPSEAALQSLAMSWHWVISTVNHYYVVAHFPITGLVMAWLFFRHRDTYLRARSAIVGGTAVALAIQIAYPLMPPRMMGDHGFIDTMTIFGPSAYGSMSSGAANQLAAMPSLHVGWAFLCFIAARQTKNRILTVVLLAHLLMTITTVTITANHYWVDGIIGISILAGGWAISGLAVAQRPVQAIRQRLQERRGEPVSQLSI